MSIEARFRVSREGFDLDVELRAPSRGVTSIFGPSGSGKTTLLRAIAGLDRHDGGFLRVGGHTWQDERVFRPPHRRPLGYVFQEASLFDHLSVRQNLEYGRRRVPEADHRIPLDHVIDLLGLGPLLERRTAHLSGGERQRVAIGRALAVSPGLLLMDEPLASLDLSSRREILPHLESLRDELEIPVLYVSHTPEETARLADHLVLLDRGRVSAAGEVQEMLTRLDLPLARGGDAAAIVDATVSGHDEPYHLTFLDFGGGRLTVTRSELPVGRHVRVRLAAQDVSLTLERQEGTSILNIFPATVEELHPEGEAQVTVRLRAGSIPLLSRVTRRSAATLDLQPGKSVYVQVKSVVLLS